MNIEPVASPPPTDSWSVIRILVMAGWGGVASYIDRIRKLRGGLARHFLLAELLGEVTISGFAGVCVAWVGIAENFNPYAVAAAAGVGAHLGTRALFILERRFLGRGGDDAGR